MLRKTDKYGKLIVWYKVSIIIIISLLFFPLFTNLSLTPESTNDQNDGHTSSIETQTKKISETDNFGSDQFLTPRTGTRAKTVTEKGANDIFNDAITSGNQFSEDSILIGSANGNDVDCFFTSSFNTWPGATKVYNISLYPSYLTGFKSIKDWIVVQLWQWWDFNENDYVEKNEEILLHQESYNNWRSSPNCWAHTSELSFYFVRVEGHPENPADILNYELYINWDEVEVSSNDTTYKIESPREVTPNTPVLDQRVDMDLEPIDWYEITPTYITGWEGVNVSIKLRITKSSLKNIYSSTDSFFILEVRAVILHETTNGKLRFGGIGNASLHAEQINYPGLGKMLDHFNIKFFTAGSSEEVVKSYLGIYAQTYGLDRNSYHIRYHDGDLSDKAEDKAMNAWLEYSFVKLNSEPVVKPVLSPVSVYSLRTKTPYGQTPDKFKYHIWYTSRTNCEPIIFNLYILKAGKVINVLKIQPVNKNNQNFRTPTEYAVIIEGSTNWMGEGNYQYQVECWDRHIYAIGSKNNKWIYDGPFIINNIPPQVRETAIKYIEMKEDDKPIYIELKDIFVDANDDVLTFAMLDSNGNRTSIYQTGSLDLRVISNKRLKIEPKPDKFGKSTINLFATDGLDPPINATHQIIVTVVPINDPPEIKTPFNKIYFFGEVRFDEDTEYSGLNLTDIFWDPVEKDPLTFMVSKSQNLKVDISYNGSVRIIPNENWSGIEELRFTATDLPGASVFDDLKVRVMPVNDAPILNDTPPIIAYEDSWTNITFAAWDPADDDPLVFFTDVAIEVELNENEYFFDSLRGRLSLFPPNRVATGATYEVSVTVRDQPPEGAGKPISVTKKVNITIRNTWDKPTCKIVEPQNGDKFLHFEPITFQGLVLDDDLKVIEVNEKITYEWFSDIDGKLGNSEVIRNVPLTAGSRGQQHKITFRVSDGKFYSQAEIYIWVLHPDDKRDTDADGMPDYWEDRNNLNKYDSADADYDSDYDGFTNFEEYTYGKDGFKETLDPTDPWDAEDIPGGTDDEVKAEEADYLTPLLILLVVFIAMIISIAGTFILISSKVRTAKDYSERKRELEEELKRQQRQKEDEKMYGIYAPKDSDVLCHNCGHRNKVRTVTRPLAVRCTQCNSRGVIY